MQTDLLLARVTRLEAEAARLRRWLVATGGLAVLATVISVTGAGRAAAPPTVPAVVEAQRFVLKDAAGATRAVLGAFEYGTGLGIYDGDHVGLMAAVAADGTGGAVEVRGADAMRRAMMTPVGFAVQKGVGRRTYTYEGPGLEQVGKGLEH